MAFTLFRHTTTIRRNLTDGSTGHFCSPENLLFQHTPIFLFLLFTFLLLTEKFFYLPRCFGQLSRLLIKSLSEILGHKNVSFTLNVYGSANLKQKVKCMNLLNDLL